MHLRMDSEGNDTFFNARVTTPNGSTAFIFLSMVILGQLRVTEQIHGDGTFLTVPDLFFQLFTLQLIAYGKVFITTEYCIRQN